VRSRLGNVVRLCPPRTAPVPQSVDDYVWDSFCEVVSPPPLFQPEQQLRVFPFLHVTLSRFPRFLKSINNAIALPGLNPTPCPPFRNTHSWFLVFLSPRCWTRSRRLFPLLVRSVFFPFTLYEKRLVFPHCLVPRRRARFSLSNAIMWREDVRLFFYSAPTTPLLLLSIRPIVVYLSGSPDSSSLLIAEAEVPRRSLVEYPKKRSVGPYRPCGGLICDFFP